MAMVHNSILPPPELATDLVLRGGKCVHSTGLFLLGHIVRCKHDGVRSTTGMHHAGTSPPRAFVPSAMTRHIEVNVTRSGRCRGASLTSVSKSIDCLPLAGNYSLKAGNYPLLFFVPEAT
jgi:hypothetical protein